MSYHQENLNQTEEEYIVTLKEMLDKARFLQELRIIRSDKIVAERPISRNTHVSLTEQEAETLRNDDRVLAVELPSQPDDIVPFWDITNEEFNKTSGRTPGANFRQWGHLHVAGDAAQRRKNVWGDGPVTDSISVYGNGQHVDVVICDELTPYDCREWYSPTTGSSRFVQYQWFAEHQDIICRHTNQEIKYFTNHEQGTDPAFFFPPTHGTHVTGTVAGQFYGWANEANIYNLPIFSFVEANGNNLNGAITFFDINFLFDYVRAFHASKPINPNTGYKNPTVTNHSWGYRAFSIDFNRIETFNYRGVVYSKTGTPLPGGWTQENLRDNYIVPRGYSNTPTAILADTEDAIADGIVVIGAAGNDNAYMARQGTEDYDNYILYTGQIDTVNTRKYIHRGSGPGQAPSAICVGALSTNENFLRTSFSNFGTKIDVFAPGLYILSSVTKNTNQGAEDTKYTVNDWYMGMSGTSMASPQVCGVAAMAASLKPRFTQPDAKHLITSLSVKDEMEFDLLDGGGRDPSSQNGSPNATLSSQNPRPDSGMISAQKGGRVQSVSYPRKNTLFTGN